MLAFVDLFAGATGQGCYPFFATGTASFSALLLLICLHSPDKLEKREIEMKPNQAYETVTRAQPKAEVHTKPCPAYEVVAHAHH